MIASPISPETVQEIVKKARAGLESSTTRISHLLSFVPDDKLEWTPSATAKSPLRLVTHISKSDLFFAQIIAGTIPVELPTVEEFFAALHAPDPTIRTRESAIALLESSTNQLLAALDSVTAESYSAPRPSPVGEFPPSFWIDIMGEHRITHTGQLEYLQTIWGDLDNHMG